MKCVSLVVTTTALVLCGGAMAAGAEDNRVALPPGEQAKFFDKQVKPILEAHCFSCHGGQPKIKGELRLTSREAILKGGRTGPAVHLAKPAESLLLQAIQYQEIEMPPKGKLPQAQIDILTRWVHMGLPWGAESDATKSSQRAGAPQVNAES